MPSAEQKKNTLIAVFGMSVLIATVLTILLTGINRLSEEFVDDQLQKFKAFSVEEATKYGREADFSHGAIHIGGWGYDTRASVDNVSLEWTQKNLLDSSRWLLSTTRVDIVPDAASSGQYFFHFAEPINIIHNSQLVAVVTFASPLRYYASVGQKNEKPAMLHTLILPQQITITPGKSAEEERETLGRIFIALEQGQLNMAVDMQSMYASLNTDLRALHLTREDGGAMTIENIQATAEETPTPEGYQSQGKVTLTLNNTVLQNEGRMSSPFGARLKLGYQRAASARPVAWLLPVLGAENLDIELLQIEGADIRLKASGRWISSAGDGATTGQTQCVIENMAGLLSAHWLAETQKQALTSALRGILGQAADEVAPRLSIMIKREKRGDFYVGRMKLADILQTIETDISKNASSPEPVLPPPMREHEETDFSP